MQKRAHNKSRFGCTRCKVRKVKCDEAQPQCTACIRHRVPCVYPGSAATATASRQSPHSHSPTATALDQNVAPSPAASPFGGSDGPVSGSLLELRLFHFFMTHTSEAISPAYSLWKTRLPLMAFDHPAVYSLLMALAALHVARLKRFPSSATNNIWGYIPTLGAFFEEQDRGDLQAISKDYFERGIRRHQSAFDSLTSHDDYESIFVGSVLVSMYSLFMLGDAPHPGPQPEKVWFELAMGPREIGTIWASFAGGNVLRQWGITYEEPNLVDDPELDNEANAEPLAALLQTGRDFEVVDQADDDAYKEALIYVGLMYKRARARDESPQSTCRRIIALPSKLNPRFRQLVIEQRHRALAILAFVFATGRLVENEILLLRGVAGTQIPGIYDRLPVAWRKLLAWPMAVLGVESVTEPSFPELYFDE